MSKDIVDVTFLSSLGVRQNRQKRSYTPSYQPDTTSLPTVLRKTWKDSLRIHVVHCRFLPVMICFLLFHYFMYFTYPALRKHSILVLPRAEARLLARRSGMREVAGFNYAAKMNPYAWPYPCPRPYFKTSWRYRLTRIKSLAGVGMQV